MSTYDELLTEYNKLKEEFDEHKGNIINNYY